MANPTLVLGGIAAGIIAAAVGVFAVPGWVAGAQDAAAIRDITDIRHAESVAFDVHGEYLPSFDALKQGEWGMELDLSDDVELHDIDAGDKGWCAVVKSLTNTYFAASNTLLGTSRGATPDEALAGANCDLWTPLVTPTAPVVTAVPDTSSSNTVTVEAGEVICEDGGVAQYRLRHRVTQESAEAKWKPYEDWGTTRTLSVDAKQGALYGFQAESRCVKKDRESEPATSPEHTVITDLAPPTTPVVTNTTSGNNTTFQWEAQCAEGANIRYYTRDYKDDATKWGAWSAGAITTSKVRATSGQGYEYKVEVQADCYTAHANSAKSGTGVSSYIRPIVPPVPTTSIVTEWSKQAVTNVSPFSCQSGLTRQWRGGYYLKATSTSNQTIHVELRNPTSPQKWTSSTLNGTHFSVLNSVAWQSTSGWSFTTMGTGSIDLHTMSLTQLKAKYNKSIEHRQVVQVKCTNPETGRSAIGDVGVTAMAKTW